MRTLYRCKAGHVASQVEPEPGYGDGPPYHCPYPCLAPIVGVAEFKMASGWRRMPQMRQTARGRS